MDISILYLVGGTLAGLLLGWLIASLRQQKNQSEHETQRRLIQQTVDQQKAEIDQLKAERQPSQ
ncbi:MAG: DNA recombination protein RmuC, partial [Ewingella sp.]|nr:DNA recombination protein RmuC [Ewingella sp.]